MLKINGLSIVNTGPNPEVKNVTGLNSEQQPYKWVSATEDAVVVQSGVKVLVHQI